MVHGPVCIAGECAESDPQTKTGVERTSSASAWKRQSPSRRSTRPLHKRSSYSMTRRGENLSGVSPIQDSLREREPDRRQPEPREPEKVPHSEGPERRTSTQARAQARRFQWSPPPHGRCHELMGRVGTVGWLTFGNGMSHRARKCL
jgi:hypothetical protein